MIWLPRTTDNSTYFAQSLELRGIESRLYRSSYGNTLNIKLYMYNKTCVKQPLSKRPKIGFQDQLSLNAGQKYCRMVQEGHSAILLTFIKLPFVIKIFFFVCFLVAVLHRFYCS